MAAIIVFSLFAVLAATDASFARYSLRNVGGQVRSSAWFWLFSSAVSTMAWAGGSVQLGKQQHRMPRVGAQPAAEHASRPAGAQDDEILLAEIVGHDRPMPAQTGVIASTSWEYRAIRPS
jgi:hypothetical protein